MRRLYTVSFHQAFRQYGVVLYNLAIDTNNISKLLRIGFDGNDLAGFLTKVYVAVVRNAGTLADSTAVSRILVFLHVMKSLASLSSWQYKEFLFSAYESYCEASGLGCGVTEPKRLLYLALDINTATDYNAVVPTARYSTRITAPGIMLLNLYSMHRLGTTPEPDAEKYARKIVEFPKRLLDYAVEKLGKVGETPLVALAINAIEELAEYQEILSPDALTATVVANDVMHLLLLYYPDKVDQVMLLGKQVVKWIEKGASI